MANRNREAGHAWERKCAQNLRTLGFENIRTSRECSRLRDSQKVDLCNSDEDTYGRFPFNIQCKTICGGAPYAKLLSELAENDPKGKDRINIIFHRMTKKQGSRFMGVGDYAIMNMSDMYDIMYRVLQYEKALEVENPLFKQIEDEEPHDS